jgi:glutamine amidotransferase
MRTIAMCRLFALRAGQPGRVRGSLLSEPHSLLRQSCGDRRGICHGSGWGFGWYAARQPQRFRSARPAQEDPRYRTLAEELTGSTILAHVRLASAGSVAERNSHPFVHGRWMFAHNGTLFGFADDPERLKRLIPEHLRRAVEGDTDSEHAFFLVLARLEQALGGLDRPAEAGTVAAVLGDTIAALAELFPGQGEDLSQFNFLVTDGRILVASRWRHSLWWVERRGAGTVDGDGPVEGSPAYRAIAVASEPTTGEAWSEVPERTLLRIGADLQCALTPLAR